MSSTALPPLSPSEPPRVFGAPTLQTDGDLLAVGIASDGTLCAVEEPGELRQWHHATRRQLSSRPLNGLAAVWAFNWACRLIAGASDDVTVWEVASAGRLASWPTPSWVTAVAFQPGSTLLATGHDDHVVRVWDWFEQRLLRELEAHSRPVSAVCFSWDGRRIATAGEDKLIHIWDAITGQRLGSLGGHKDRIPALAWHPDHRRLFSAGWDTTVRVWDTATFQPIILLNSHATQVHTVALSGDGRLLASADSGNAVHVWDANRLEAVLVLRDASAEVRCLAFPPSDGRGDLSAPLLVFGGADRVIHLWDSRQGATSAAGVDPLVSRTTVAVSPDGGRLYSLGAATDLRVWELAGGDTAVKLEGEPVLRAFALSPDGAWLACARPEREEEDRTSLSLYDAPTGHRVAVCAGQRGPITALAFRPDSQLFAAGGIRSSDVWLWRVPGGEPELLIPDAVDDCGVEALAFHPTRPLVAVAGIDWLATGRGDGEVAVWDIETNEIVLILPDGATAVAFDPAGRQLACATLRRTICVHDFATGRLVFELRGHQDTVACLAYSPDGRWLATGGEDRTLRLWDAATGAQAAAWELDNPVFAVAFSPDGRQLFTGNANRSCYQIDVAQLLAEA